MSIKKSFNGTTIRKPGAYSKMKVDNSAGAPLRATDTLMVVGESSKGAAGAVTGIVEFSAERLSDLVAYFGEGPIVDVALAAARPSRTNGVGGASVIKVFKTNATTFAEASVASIFKVKDIAGGVEGNQIAVEFSTGSSAEQKVVAVSKVGETTETLGQNEAKSVIQIKYNGDATAALLEISGVTQQEKVLKVTLTGQTDSTASLNISLKNHTMKTLAEEINSKPGYACSVVTTSLSQKSALELDPVASTSAKVQLELKRVQVEILELLNSSQRIEAEFEAVPAVGIPAGVFALAGGAQGASSNTDFSNGFAASLSEEYNVLLPAVSRDASEDIADEVQGFTDVNSTYTISAIITAADTHIRLRSSTKNRKEAQGFAGIRKQQKAEAFAAISAIGSEYMQVMMQDCLIVDSKGNETFKHPHVTAALAAGIRLGQAVGEPLTFKFVNSNQIGHFINPITGLEQGDFNPGLDFDQAIDAGVLFLEKAAGGFRIVVDNTTYGQDDSFIFNRGSVMAAAMFVNKTLRETAELVFVGKKVSNGAAQSIKNVIRNKLRELNAPDVNIITASAGAPEGFREDTFVVTVEGNTAKVQVEYCPCNGLDFIFFDFTIGEIRQQA